MAINLQKGQRVDLTKGNPGLSKIMVGLGWDPVEKSGGGKGKGGLLGSLLAAAEIQDQMSIVMHLLFCLDENDKLKK